MTSDQIVDEYVPKLGGREFADAKCVLIQAGDAVVPLLITRFRQAKRAELRREVIEVLYELAPHARPELLSFLLELVTDADPYVWRRALDGLVSANEKSVIPALEAHAVSADDERASWIREAAGQIADGVA